MSTIARYSDNFGGENASDFYLIKTMLCGDWAYSSIVRGSNGVVTSASVVWPDDSTGTLTVTKSTPAYLSIDEYNVTHDDSGKTVTQPEVTRDAAGRLITSPFPVVT